MAKLTRTSSGLWTARKVIPASVRDAYGKREEKPTWPSSLTQGQARAEFAAWLLRVEERITALRSVDDGPRVDLSQRQSLALAGEWYGRMSQRHGENPGDEIGWEMALEQVLPEDGEAAYRAYLDGDERPYDGPWRRTAYLVAERDALLEGEGISVTPSAAERLLDDMTGLYVSFCFLMMRRAAGDYGGDPVAEMLPAWKPPQPPLTTSAEVLVGLSISDLFDGYVAERKPAPATIKAWRRMMGQLEAFLKHNDSTRVSAEDVIRWKDHLLTEPTKLGTLRSAKTVRETYLAAAKTVFGWGKENRKITDDPTVGIKVRGGKRQRLRDPGFSNDEARTILKATLDVPPARMSKGHASARRWVPWLCAYSGARVNEITQLRKQDIVKRDGVWAMNITPEAGSVKNGVARVVPLHSHLIGQGFLEFVKAAATGPLFYDPAGHRGGSDGNPQYKKVGERLAVWVRSLGISDPGVAPNHGWRHRFKTVARGVRMDPEAREIIPGHALATEGQNYGSWPLDQLAEEVERLPRISLGEVDAAGEGIGDE